jgi:hypothetical protein
MELAAETSDGKHAKVYTTFLAQNNLGPRAWSF